MAQTVDIMNCRDLTEPFGDLPVVPPRSEPLRLMPETPLEFRVPENATNVGTSRDVNVHKTNICANAITFRSRIRIQNSLKSTACGFWVNQTMSNTTEAPRKLENCGCWFRKDKGQ
jgi:hypothetical protein